MTAQEIVACVERLQRRQNRMLEYSVYFQSRISERNFSAAGQYSHGFRVYAMRAAHEAHILLRLAEGREA